MLEKYVLDEMCRGKVRKDELQHWLAGKKLFCLMCATVCVCFACGSLNSTAASNVRRAQGRLGRA